MDICFYTGLLAIYWYSSEFMLCRLSPHCDQSSTGRRSWWTNDSQIKGTMLCLSLQEVSDPQRFFLRVWSGCTDVIFTWLISDHNQSDPIIWQYRAFVNGFYEFICWGSLQCVGQLWCSLTSSNTPAALGGCTVTEIKSPMWELLRPFWDLRRQTSASWVSFSKKVESLATHLTWHSEEKEGLLHKKTEQAFKNWFMHSAGNRNRDEHFRWCLVYVRKVSG